MERSKMSYCTKFHVSWKWNYGGLKFMFEEAFCVLRMRNELFHFWSVVSRDSCVIFLSFIDLACGVMRTVLFRKSFLFWWFLLFRETLGKNPETSLEPPQHCQYPLALYLKVFYIAAGISTPAFALTWKTAQFLPFATLLYMFHVTWITFIFNRNQLGTVSAFFMSSVPWSNQRAHQVISENLLSKEFHCMTANHN